MAKNVKPNLGTYVGLSCALGVPLFIFPTRILHNIFQIPGGFWPEEAIIWGLAAAVVFILFFWEKLPLSTIGLHRPTWSSLAWGFGGAIAIRITGAIALVTYATISGASITRAFGHDLSLATKLGTLPLVAIVLLALRAAVTEEILFRGYAIERLGAVIGSRTIAACASLAAFAIAHLGAWDLNYLVVAVPAGVVLTLQYLWQRDLVANIYAHFFTDARGLGVAYAIAHHLGFPLLTGR